MYFVVKVQIANASPSVVLPILLQYDLSFL